MLGSGRQASNHPLGPPQNKLRMASGRPPPPQSPFPAGKPERTRVCTCLELSLPWAGRPWVSAPPSVNGPQPAMPGQPHPQHGPAPPFPAKHVIKHGAGRGSDRDCQPCGLPLPQEAPPSLHGVGGNPPRPLKAQKRPPAVSPQPRKGGERRQERGMRMPAAWKVGAARCPLGGSGDGLALDGAPPSVMAAGGADGGSGRCWPRPAPGDPTASPSPPCAGRGGGLGAGDGPRARRGSRPLPAPPVRPALTGLSGPRPLQQPLRGPHVLRLHRLHQFLLLPHGATGAAATRLSSVRSARLRGGGGPAAPAASSSLPRRLLRRPRPSLSSGSGSGSGSRRGGGGERVTGGGRPGGGGRRRRRRRRERGGGRRRRRRERGGGAAPGAASRTPGSPFRGR